MPPSLDAALLTRVTLFNGVAASALPVIAAEARLVRRAPGRPFFTEGEAATTFFVIVSGRVKLVQLTPEGHEVILRIIGPGDVFGTVSAFAGDKGVYPVSVVPVGRTEAAAWDGAAMARLMAAHPVIAMNALRTVASRLHDLQRRHRELMTERVEQRIARALLRLVQHAGRRSESGIEIDFPLSRQDLADMTGTSLFTVSRVVSAWQARGLVAAGRRRLTIRRPHALVVIAEDLPA
ncbi:MAG: Crp/Fnr family transcriptional regulator [Vicinamibacteraceae bacterium]|nr:Crp/Fnr family transcriptional regulator [Vicinamibacteraceae bacterium]MCL4814182.1 Crp/Fnr family transcriptional regulator [Vicinamibacteraceae bacterium]